MFRLIDDAFNKNKELHTMSVYCLTETIKIHLENYFEEDYKNEEDEVLYTKVKIDKVYELLPDELIEVMKNIGVNITSFIPKKIAQFMILLRKPEEITPDIFLEYILYKMIKKQSKSMYDYSTTDIDKKKIALKNLLTSYAKDELNITDIKDINEYVSDKIILLTDFTSLLGVEEPDDDSLTFWDWDFSLFDDLGFEVTIKQLAYGHLSLRGYGLDYTKSIFSSIGEEIPSIINDSV